MGLEPIRLRIRPSNVPVCQFQHYRERLDYTQFSFGCQPLFLEFADKMFFRRQTIRMNRLSLIIFCLLLLGCQTPHILSVDPEPTEAVEPTEEPIRPEVLLRTKTVSFVLPDGEEVVSLGTIGFTTDRFGKLTLNHTIADAWIRAFIDTYTIFPKSPVIIRSDSFDTPYEFLPEQNGSMPDREALQSAVYALDPTKEAEPIVVPFTTIPAEQTMEELMRSNTLLATYTTSFQGKKLDRKNRVHNILLAAQKINGIVVAPGETFSMNETIGDRTKANGYLPAGAITNGMSVTEYGGGVCQVSTTLFNAVLMADLEVVERYHHSWPMEYAPVGRDATIATGQKDFRFLNSSSEPMTIFAWVDESERTVSVSLYGKHSEEFDHIEIVSEQLKRLPSKQGERILDASLPAGTIQIERKSRRGRLSVTYQDFYDAEGTLIKRVTAFEDTYPSIGEIAYVSSDIYYGTAETLAQGEN